MRIFGIDPGSVRTGYGCVDTDGTRHRMVTCGALATSARDSFPERLRTIHDGLRTLITAEAPHCVVIENLFHARNVRSALTLGHARGVAMLAAIESDLPVFEYTPAEIKVAVVGYGRAEKGQVQQMVKLLLGLDTAPTPHDAADALAIALCHAHRTGGGAARVALAAGGASRSPSPRSWRQMTPAQLARRSAT